MADWITPRSEIESLRQDIEANAFEIARIEERSALLSEILFCKILSRGLATAPKAPGRLVVNLRINKFFEFVHIEYFSGAGAEEWREHWEEVSTSLPELSSSKVKGMASPLRFENDQKASPEEIAEMMGLVRAAAELSRESMERSLAKAGNRPEKKNGPAL